MTVLELLLKLRYDGSAQVAVCMAHLVPRKDYPSMPQTDFRYEFTQGQLGAYNKLDFMGTADEVLSHYTPSLLTKLLQQEIEYVRVNSFGGVDIWVYNRGQFRDGELCRFATAMPQE